MAAAKPWWLAFGAVTFVAATSGIGAVQTEQREFLLPGTTSHGHYQIELSCESCHTPYLSDMQDACMRCHGEELERVDDSHPARKFRDPRNADRLEAIDAMRCVTCHVEHEPEATLTMGLTQPADFCFHCHSDVGEERETHKGLEFDTCQNEGCHNFHDNRALNEDFLAAHLNEPALMERPQVPLLATQHGAEQGSEVDGGVGERILAPDTQHRAGNKVSERATELAPDAPVVQLQDEALVEAWRASAHAAADVNCSACHEAAVSESSSQGQQGAFVEQPGRDVCGDCHATQVSTFEQGKHGMRLAEGLSPMTPGRARLPMRPEASKRELGCESCHSAHGFDRKHASVEACLGCHADEHSLAYKSSAHFAAFEAESAGKAPVGSGVSCATCHLPRSEDPAGEGVHVQHNQNDNLRPSEKMVRSVCAHCHGLEFSLSALMETALVKDNFRRAPGTTVKGLEWVRTRAERP